MTGSQGIIISVNVFPISYIFIGVCRQSVPIIAHLQSIDPPGNCTVSLLVGLATPGCGGTGDVWVEGCSVLSKLRVRRGE